MDPELWDDESPPGSPSAASQSHQDGHHDGDGEKSGLLREMEEEVESLLVILRDAGTGMDDELARKINYKIARIEAARDAAISKPRGSMVWRYFIKPAATGFVRALFHTGTAFIGCCHSKSVVTKFYSEPAYTDSYVVDTFIGKTYEWRKKQTTASTSG